MKNQKSTSSRKFLFPLLSLVLLLSIFIFQPGMDSSNHPEQILARAAHLNFSHPLEYDPSLGMFGHSDHVGYRYPFSPEALAQPLPPRLVAAGLQEPEVDGKILSAAKEVLHHDAEHRDSNAVLAVDSTGSLWVAYTSFTRGDEEIYVQKRETNGEWKEAFRLSRHPLPDFNPSIATDGNGGVWVVWSRQEEDGSWPLMGRQFKGQEWGATRALVRGKHFYPVLATTGRGEVWMAWENWDTGSSRINTARWNGREWSSPGTVLAGSGSQQRPALSVGPAGTLWIAFDEVRERKYDVVLAEWKGNDWSLKQPPPKIEGHRRSARIAVDKESRVWLLPETLVIEPIQVRRAFYGQDVLYNLRPPSRSLLVWDDNSWKAVPPGPAMTAKAASLHIDSQGTVWIFARTPGPGTRDFLTVGQRYRGEQWYTGPLSEPAWRKNSENRRFQLGEAGIGSVKERVSLAEFEGQLLIAWHETHREFTWEPAWTYADGPVDTILHRLPLETTAYESPSVVDFDPGYHGTSDVKVEPLPHTSLKRQDILISVGNQEVEVYYGDLHHHTEFSRDPGVLNDDVDGNYRYLRDIRQLDFAGLADHTEHLNEHDWYRIRRAARFYNNPDHFVTFVTFEWTSEFYRGGNLQEGHHNVVQRTDGPEVRYYSASVPQSNTPLRLTQRLEEDIERARERNLQANAFLFPHDPSRSVQPITWSWYNPRIRLLELVQSRGAHEILGGPQKPPLRNDIQQLVGKSAQDGLSRGFRWGFIGSGDHQGRPLAAVAAPFRRREDLFDGLYDKRTFATTGARMIVNFSVNGHPMGTEWKSDETEHDLSIHALGTAPISLVEVWKNRRLLHRWSPLEAKKEFKVEFKDPSAPYFRENWWYVRVMQQDGEIAWSSPVWFVYTGIQPRVIADAGHRQTNFIVSDFPVPIPILMRNQKDEKVVGSLRLLGAPAEWNLDPGPEMEIELDPESWTTYVWYVKAPAGSIQELSMVPVRLLARFEGEADQEKALLVVQSPRLLERRGQMDEIHDAVQLQDDPEVLNAWLKRMSSHWFDN